MNGLPKGPRASLAGRRSRRDVLKTGVIAGGVLWAAPAITTVSRAFAQGSPLCDQCSGTAFAFSQDVVSPASRFPTTPGPCPTGFCQGSLSINQPAPTQSNPLSARSGLLCACHDAATCRSEASIASLFVELHRSLFRNPITGVEPVDNTTVEADALSSFTDADCPACTVQRGSDTTNIRVRDPSTGLFVSVSNAPPNTVVLTGGLLFPGFRVVANEQSCTPAGRPYTAALHVRLPDATPAPFGRDVFLAYSESGFATCTNCVPAPEGMADALLRLP